MSRTVDIFELSRTRRTIAGEATLTDMPQLESGLDGETREASVHWKAVGEAGVRGLAAARLFIKAVLVTQCVRCGKACEIEIEKELPFLFTKTEAEADALPIEEDGDYDIVVGSTHFDPVDWVEEELILSLPAFPQHLACEPDREKLQTKETGETQQKTNPFAVLASLKKR